MINLRTYYFKKQYLQFICFLGGVLCNDGVLSVQASLAGDFFIKARWKRLVLVESQSPFSGLSHKFSSALPLGLSLEMAFLTNHWNWLVFQWGKISFCIIADMKSCVTLPSPLPPLLPVLPLLILPHTFTETCLTATALSFFLRQLSLFKVEEIILAKH